MKKNLTEIVSVVDRSGSMNYIKQDAIGGFNTFIEAQKKGRISNLQKLDSNWFYYKTKYPLDMSG